MTRRTRQALTHSLMATSIAMAIGGCIAEDLSECPQPCEKVTIHYVVKHLNDSVVTFDPVFDTIVNSLHTGFWKVADGKIHEEQVVRQEQMPDDLTFYLTLPYEDDYNHIAIANDEAGNRQLFPERHTEVTCLAQEAGDDTIMAPERPILAGTIALDMYANRAQDVHTVPLYAVMSKMELNVKHVPTLTNIRCYIRGTKGGYHCWQQAFTDNKQLVTDATARAANAGKDSLQYRFYTYPTAVERPAAQPVLKQADEPNASKWVIYFLSDNQKTGKTVQHVFTIKRPVYAGDVFRGDFSIWEDGGSYNTVTGAEIDTDWKPGNGIEIEL